MDYNAVICIGAQRRLINPSCFLYLAATDLLSNLMNCYTVFLGIMTARVFLGIVYDEYQMTLLYCFSQQRCAMIIEQHG